MAQAIETTRGRFSLDQEQRPAVTSYRLLRRRAAGPAGEAGVGRFSRG